MSDPIPIKTQSEKERLLARSLFYQILSVLFRHPSLMAQRELLKKETSRWMTAVRLLEGMDQERLKQMLRLLIEELNKTTPSEWIRQYEGCFGHTAHGVVPSYELEYGETQSLREPYQLGDIAAFYHAFGLKVNGKIHERVDHITVECEFMHFCIFKEAYALDKDLKEEAMICQKAATRFLREHLGRWAPSFTLRLSEHCTGGLIKRTADFAFCFITQDCLMLGIKPGAFDLPIRVCEEKEDTGCGSCPLNTNLGLKNDGISSASI